MKPEVDQILGLSAGQLMGQIAPLLPNSFAIGGASLLGIMMTFAAQEYERGADIRVAENADITGFVILHGTSTLEETAFFLNLTLASPHTVVLVGAQRPASALGTDAGANLVAALRVASAPEARGLGVLVVLNDEIHAARDVVKTSTYRLQTFRSLDFGALGHVDGDGVPYHPNIR